MLEGLFNQIAGQIPPTVPPISSQKSLREPLQPRVYRPVPWVPSVRSEKYKTQNTQPLSDQDRQKILDYLAAIGETDDRHYCRECCFMKNRRCQRHGFWPVDNIPRRCVDFLYKEND